MKKEEEDKEEEEEIKKKRNFERGWKSIEREIN